MNLPPLTPRSEPSKTSNRTKVLAGLSLVLTGAGIAAPFVAPQPPQIVHCTDNVTLQVETPSLFEQLIHPRQVDPQNFCSDEPSVRAAVAGEALDQMGGKQFVWPFSQKMAAALDRAHVTGDYGPFEKLVAELEDYRHPAGGYSPSTHPEDRYYDDNAWLGLDFLQAYTQRPDQPQYLEKAREIFRFLEEGFQPGGGILWKENAEHPSYNTCALGPTTELAARLHEATGDQRYLDLAQQMDSFTDTHLRRADGLYSDSVRTDFTHRDESLMSYNQGSPVGAKMVLHRITGDEKYKADAVQTAKSAVRHYREDDRLWKHAPVFNAVMFRNLMELDDPEVTELLTAYLQRVWQQALGPAGLFDKPAGLGTYEGHELQMIDQAGLVQLFALQAWPTQDLPKVG